MSATNRGAERQEKDEKHSMQMTLRNWIETSGMTHRQVAAKLGIHPASLSRVLRGLDGGNDKTYTGTSARLARAICALTAGKVSIEYCVAPGSGVEK